MSLSHLYRDGDGHLDDDDDERENFEITDWDLQNEFNPNRQRHWQTKEEATYGVWAERDSDEERPSFGGKRYCLLGSRGWVGTPGVSSPGHIESCSYSILLCCRAGVACSFSAITVWWKYSYLWIEVC